MLPTLGPDRTRSIVRLFFVERISGWLGSNRRLAKDYEREGQTSETLIEVAMIRLILRRLARAA
jgi:putative transposase